MGAVAKKASVNIFRSLYDLYSRSLFRFGVIAYLINLALIPEHLHSNFFWSRVIGYAVLLTGGYMWGFNKSKKNPGKEIWE